MKRATGMAMALLLTLGVGAGPLASPAQATGDGWPRPSQRSIDSLARDVERVESVREVKDLQRTYVQLLQFGQWKSAAALFADNGTFQWGDQTVTGRRAIADWLRTDAGAMDGIRRGSLHTVIADEPLINLSVDGRSAKVRWAGLRFLGDGAGATRIEGGIYENEYVLQGRDWKISLLHYYPQYAGPYETGWRNVGGPLPIVPYHFDPNSAGVPIPEPTGTAPRTRASAEELANRIERLNDEDSVRNLQHAYGYYVDRRMWSDVVDLFAWDSKVVIDGVGVYRGSRGVRQAMERMGPENLTQGILNDHVIFDTIVDVKSNGREAVTRGIELGMIGDANTRAASWEFNVFRNEFVQERNGVWKLKELHITPLIVAPYIGGWGTGGTAPRVNRPPAFLDVLDRGSSRHFDHGGWDRHDSSRVNVTDLKRRLNRSAAYDATENVSAAYTAYLDDLRLDEMALIHAQKGHKLSPFAGYFQGPERIAAAGHAVYGANPPVLRNSLSFHWRPQPVITVSHDGRSASLRARLLQPRTSANNAGTFNGAMYNDQFVVENGVWKVWSLTIDEFYWSSVNWAGGWSAANPRDPNLPDPAPSALVTRYPPDVLHSTLGVRSAGFQGGSGGYIQWPGIVPMWFHYRNPVTGRVPQHYWPDCAPCEVRPDWRLTANGYQLPPTGPQIDGVEVRR